MSQYLEKFNNFRQIIKWNGGIKASFLQFYRTDELKMGKLVGEDKYGNKYYENKAFFMGRSRWVQYPDKVGMDYDGSQIPAEWHRWMHYMADETPVEKPLTKRKWMSDHEENPSATPQEYVPYTTTKPKVESWQPPKSS